MQQKKISESEIHQSLFTFNCLLWGIQRLMDIAFLLAIPAMLLYAQYEVLSAITPSTLDREPLTSSFNVSDEYYTDRLRYIKDDSTLENGMRRFYEETGVQPYLYITDEVNGEVNPTVSQIESFSDNLYGELFADEAHLLLLLVIDSKDGSYTDWVTTGTLAQQVIDNEAENILLDYVDRYCSTDNVLAAAHNDSANKLRFRHTMSVEEALSKVFKESAIRMMSKSMNPLLQAIIDTIKIIVIAVLAFALLGGLAFNKIRKCMAVSEKRKS